MNIDLLFTKHEEAGLVSSKNLVKKAIGLVFDTQTGVLTLEYADMDYLEFNIPVDEDYFKTLDRCSQIHVGAIKNGNIAQAYQIPFMFLDDPYRNEALNQVQQIKHPLRAFDLFVKQCVSGQPVHRDDLSNENTMGCILGETGPAGLEFAPHLARRHSMEVSPKMAPGNTPRFSAPGLGGGGGGSRSSHRSFDDDQEE